MNIVISYDGSDITDDVITKDAIFSSQVNGSPGSCSFKVKDPNRDKVFVTGKEIALDIDGSRAWFGFITSIKRAYAFAVDNTNDDTRLLAIEGVDINVLFRRRFLYKKSHPATIEGPVYPVATADTTAIADLVANWLDLSSDGLDTSSLVTNVGNINIDQVAQPFAGGMSWEEAMRTVARITGAVFYLNPSKKLVYVDVDTVSAPFAISDTPSGGEVGYRSMSILNDATAMVNDVLALGAGGGSPTPVAKRQEDATSIAAHGRWQEGTLRSGVYKQATINKVADSIINGSPLSHRGHKDDHVSVEATIRSPGLLPANKVSVTSDVFGYNDVLPVRRMDITFPTPTNALYRLTLSHELDDPFDPFDLVKLKFPGGPGGGFPGGGWVPPWPPAQHVIFDAYDRTVASPSWGTSTDGHLWVSRTIVGRAFPNISVNGVSGLVPMTDNQAADMTVYGTGPWEFDTDFTLTARFTFVNFTNVFPGGGGAAYSPPRELYFVVGSDTTSDSFIDDNNARVYFLLATNRFDTEYRVAVQGSNGSQAFPVGPIKNAPLLLRWEHMPDSLGLSRAKLWKEGTTEPTSWLVSRSTAADSYVSPNGGYINGFQVIVQNGAVITANKPLNTFDVAIDYIDFTFGTDVVDTLPAAGWVCEDLTILAYDYTTTGFFRPGTLNVYVNGILQRPVGPVVDYEVHTLTHSFTMSEIPTGTLRVCYDRILPTGGYPIAPITR